MRIFLTSVFAQIFLSAYVFYKGYRALPCKKKWLIPFFTFGCLELCLYFFAYFFYQVIPDSVLYFIQMVCGTWFIATIYLFILLIFLDFLRLIDHVFPFFPAFIRNNKEKTNYVLFVVCTISVIFIWYNGYYHFKHPLVTTQEIHIAKKVNGIKKLKIAFAADIHLGDIINKKEVQQYVNLINRQQCDMIIFGGDQIDYDMHSIVKNGLNEEFRQLHAPLGIYAVLGNHEYRLDVNKKIEWMKKAGMTVLKDSVAMPKIAFYLIGRDDATNAGRKSLNYLLTGLDKSKPMIVVDHQPVNLYEEVRNKTDLAIFGHVHDGQIFPHNYVVKLFWNGFSKGYRKIGDTNFFITSGLGLSGPPFRIGTRSEIVVFEIYFE